MTALAASVGAESVRPVKKSFESGGRRVVVEEFVPESETRAPAVLVLHGAGGIDYGNRYVRQLATAFASSGYATLLVHYFDRTGTSYASDATIHANFNAWLETIHDAVSFAADHPKVDKSRIAVLGYSLGAYLAVAHSARDPRVRAVIEVAGGVDSKFAKGVRRMPPTMIVHGEDDQRVLFERALELKALLARVGAPFLTRFYRGESHILSPAAGLDALGHGFEFLREHMR